MDLDAARSLSVVNPKGAVLPSFVSGRLTGVRSGETLAVAVNGRIVATAESFGNRGQTVFTALVLSSSFRSGENRVEVFVLQGSGLAPRWPPLAQSTTAGYALVEGGRRAE